MSRTGIRLRGRRAPPRRLRPAGLFALLLLSGGGGPVRAQAIPRPELEGLPVRRIEIVGLESMDEAVVRRRLALHTGGPWHAVTARRDEQAVTGLMIFWSVRIIPLPRPDDAAPREVDVEVRLEERFGWFVLPQIQYEEETGWSFGAAVGHFNLLRRGHWLYISALGGGSRYLSTSFSNSWNGPRHESFRIGGAAVSIGNRLYGFRETGERFNLELGRWAGRTGRVAGGLDYRRVEGVYPGWTGAAAGTPFAETMHAVWGRVGLDTTDPWTWPRPGHTTSFLLEGYGGFLGGDLSGSLLTARTLHRVILAPRLLAAGYGLVQVTSGDRPFWRLLPLGGMNSLRGYELGTWLVERRWEMSAQIEWHLVPVRTFDLGAMGDQIVGITTTLFLDAGRGQGIRRAPDPGSGSGTTPTLYSFGGGLLFYNALLGTMRLELAWPGDGGSPVLAFGLEAKF